MGTHLECTKSEKCKLTLCVYSEFPHNPWFKFPAARPAGLRDYPAFKRSQMLQPFSIFLAQVSSSNFQALKLHKLFCVRASATLKM